MTEKKIAPEDEQFFTRKELARLLQVRPERIRRWERRGLIPRLAPAGTRLVLYPRAAVLAWLARIDANERAGLDQRAQHHGRDGRVSPTATEGTSFASFTGYQEPTWWVGGRSVLGPMAREMA